MQNRAVQSKGVHMLAAWYKKQMETKAREEGREEGRAQNQEAWKAWLEKLEAWERQKAEAQKEGKVLDEIRPSPPGDGWANPG